MSIRALLTDLDGVIRYWDPAIFEHAEAAHRLPARTLRQLAFAPDLLQPVITGKISDEEWRQQIARRLQTRHVDCDATAAVQQWSRPAGAVVQPVLALIRRCRRRVPVILVTNATSRLQHDLAALDLVKEFDHVINSSVVGVAKPAAGIFAAALAAVDVAADEAFFVDDSAANVSAAQQLGLHAHHFQTVDGLQQSLSDHQLL